MYRRAIGLQNTGSASLPPRVPPPSHRHGTPSGPWPFLDIEDQVDPTRIEDPDSHIPMSASPCEHEQTRNQDVCWCKYPQSLYPNWALRQQKKSKIAKFVEKQKSNCTIHYLDVMDDGMFVNATTREVNERTQDKSWIAIQQGRPPGVQVRALFVEGLSGSVLRMLGTQYNIEPFFFSSTLGWIPSRHQTHLVANESDHITITLTFIRSISNQTTAVPTPASSAHDLASINDIPRQELPDLVIDTQAPLPLRSSKILLLPDQLAVHMIRSPTGNTIISLHQSQEHRATTAKALHSRVQLTGRSVYWSNIFRDTNDPTFVFLSLLWYALYAWDEALEHLYNHICFLESRVITTHDIHMTNELHVIRAHLLHYESLLEDFSNTVRFVQDTPNPALQPQVGTPLDDTFDTRTQSAMMMKRECGNLLSDIDRLERSRRMQAKRLKNVMDLGFSSVNIEDSKRMQKLTESAVNDSAAMKIIAYLTMAFLPASFVAAVFGMNVREINPDSLADLPHYVAAALPLTAVTIWIIVAYQIQITEPRIRNAAAEANGLPKEESQYTFYGFGKNAGGDAAGKKLDIWARLWWPVILLSSMLDKMKRRKRERSTQTRIDTIQIHVPFASNSRRFSNGKSGTKTNATKHVPDLVSQAMLIESAAFSLQILSYALHFYMARKPPSPSPGPGWVALNEAPTSDSSGEEDEIVDDNDGDVIPQLNPVPPPRKRKEADQLESLSKRPKHEQHHRLSGILGSTSASIGTRPKMNHNVASGSAAGSSRTPNATIASGNSISAGRRPSSSMLPPPVPSKSHILHRKANSFSSQSTASSKVSGKSFSAAGSGSRPASQNSLNADASSSSPKKKDFPTSLSSNLFDRAKPSPSKAGPSSGRSVSSKEPPKSQAHTIRPRSITNEFIDLSAVESPPSQPKPKARMSLPDTNTVVDVSDEGEPPRKPLLARKSTGGRMAPKPPSKSDPVEVIEISSDSDEEPPPKASLSSQLLKSQSSNASAPGRKSAAAPPSNTQKQKKAFTSRSASETDKMNVDVPPASAASRPQFSGSSTKSIERIPSKRASPQAMQVDNEVSARPVLQATNESRQPGPSNPVTSSLPPASSRHQRGLSGLKIDDGPAFKHKQSSSQDMQVDDVQTSLSASTTRTQTPRLPHQPETIRPTSSIRPQATNEATKSNLSIPKPPMPPASKHVRSPSGSKLDERVAHKKSSSRNMQVDGTAQSVSITPAHPQASKPVQPPGSSISSKTNAPGSSSRPIDEPIAGKREPCPVPSLSVSTKSIQVMRPQVAIKSASGTRPTGRKIIPSSSSSESGDEDKSSPSHRSLGASSNDDETVDRRSLDQALGLTGPSLTARTPERTMAIKKQPISSEISRISVSTSVQSSGTLPTHGPPASQTSQAAVASGSKTTAASSQYRGDTIDSAIDLTSDNQDDAANAALQLQSVVASSQKLVTALSNMKGKGRAIPLSPNSPKSHAQTPRSGTDELLLKPSEEEPSPPPTSPSPVIFPFIPANTSPKTAEGINRSATDRTRHSAPVMHKPEVMSAPPAIPQVPHTTRLPDAIPKATLPLRPPTQPVSSGSKLQPSIHTILSETSQSPNARSSDVKLPPADANRITPKSPPTTQISTNETRAKLSPAASRISSSASFKVLESSVTPSTVTAVADPAQLPRSMEQDNSASDDDLAAIFADVEMQDPQTSEDEAKECQALIEEDHIHDQLSDSEPEIEPEQENGLSKAWREPASAISEVDSSNEAGPSGSGSSLPSAIRRMSRRSSRSSTSDAWPAPFDDDPAEHDSAPASRNTTPEDVTVPAVLTGKTLGGFPAITWKEYRQDLDNFTPKCLHNGDLPHSLQDQINFMSEHMQKMPALRDVFQAMILENTIENEPYAPPIQVVNDIDDEPTPPWEFHYTNEMWHGDGVPSPDIKNLTSCNCKGGCNPKSKTCACLKHQRKEADNPDMEFAYDKSGRLKTPGYPVFECNDLCGCGDECRNRVVQHGRTVQVVIKKTQYKGWGVFAGSKKILCGTFIGIYSGELLTDAEAHKRGTFYNKSGKTYLFDLDFYHLKKGEGWTSKYTVDAYQAGNFTRFLNHSCNPNCSLQPCYINEGNKEKPLLVFFSDRDIEPHEEICFNYSGDSDDADGPGTQESAKNDDKIYAKCMCGAPNCTGIMFK